MLSLLVRRRGGVAVGTDMANDGRGIFDGRGFWGACGIFLVSGALEMFRVAKARRAEPAAGGRKKLLKREKREKTRKRSEEAGWTGCASRAVCSRSLACLLWTFRSSWTSRSVASERLFFFIFCLSRESFV